MDVFPHNYLYYDLGWIGILKKLTNFLERKELKNDGPQPKAPPTKQTYVTET